MSLIDLARSYRSAMEELAQDETAGIDQVHRLAAAARRLGQQWASLGGEDKPTSGTMLACFTGWLDLEQAFCAGVHDIELREAEDLALADADALASEDADAHLDLERDALFATMPGLQAWCLQHPRAAHHCAWLLFDTNQDPDHLAALAFLVEQAVDIEPGADGGLRLRIPGARSWIYGNTLVDVVGKARG